jgi:endonuclease G
LRQLPKEEQMIKNIAALFVAVFLCMSNAQAQQNPPRPMSDCQTLAPHGFPQANIPGGVGICRNGYALLHDNRVRLASWVVYTLHSVQTLACLPRDDAFQADQSLPLNGRSDPSDYRRSGYDMGHLAPNADMSWDALVQRESFLMSNMAPQLPGLNRGLWRELEAAIRSWAYASNGSVTIYTGSIYAPGDPAIGRGVVVPRGFYKIVINNQNGETLAFLFPHTASLPGDIAGVQSTVAEIEQYTGVVFPIPDNKTMRRPIWNSNGRALLAARQAQCRR